jgi:hypothetical protein
MFSLQRSTTAVLVALIFAWLLAAVVLFGDEVGYLSPLINQYFLQLLVFSLSLGFLAGLGSLVVIAYHLAKQIPLSRRTVISGGFGLITFTSAFVILVYLYEISQCESMIWHCDLGWASTLLDAIF